MSQRVFYKTNAVIHAIKYTHTDGIKAISDERTRWAYVVLNEEETKEYLNKKSNHEEEIKNKYIPYLIDAIKQEEERTYHIFSLRDSYYEVKEKLVYCTSALNIEVQLGYYIMLKTSGFIEEANKLGKPKTKKEENVSKLYFDEKIAQDKLLKEYIHYSVQSDESQYLKDSMIVAIPYVYNFEDNKNINSKLIAKIVEEEATSSYISKYSIKTRWCDEDKKEINKLLLKDSKKVYYHVQTKNIEDGTIAELTLFDNDLFIDDKIGKIPFTINNNEAYVQIDFNTIKINLLKAFRDEEFLRKQIDELLDDITMSMELIGKIRIQSLKIIEKFEENKLKIEPEYIKIGTRALQNVPTSNSFPSEIIPISTLVGVLAKIGESLLDKLNLEPIHEQLSFLNNNNIGFTSIQIQNYGQIKTDEEMTEKQTIEAIKDYSWNYYYCDEDTFKEAVYQTINEYEYSSSQTIHQMNLEDIKRLQRTESQETTTLPSFTRINSLSPKDARKYDLFHDNCQDFIYRVLQKNESLEKNLIKNEELGVYGKEKGVAPINFSMGGF